MEKEEQINELNRLKTYFSTVKIPEGRIEVTKSMTCIDMKATIETGLSQAYRITGTLACEARIGDLKMVEKWMRENSEMANV